MNGGQVEHQLVVEVFVSDLARSLAFYERLGFERKRVDGDFAALAWDGCELYLDQIPIEQLPTGTQANVRIMVPDVDRYWALALEMGARVLSPIGDRYYGLRDFTVSDPDGFGLRFATRL